MNGNKDPFTDTSLTESEVVLMLLGIVLFVAYNVI